MSEPLPAADPPGGGDPSRGAEVSTAVDPLRGAAETMRAVRERCVWSAQMTHRALVPYLVEESAELIDAVETGTPADLREELGDLLWQVLFHAEIASRSEVDPFDIDDVARALTEKMTRRHPHVFAGETAETPEQVLVLWNAAKAAEKRTRTSVLDGVSPHMPTLAFAQKLLSRSARLPSAPPDPVTADSARQQFLAETAGEPQGLGEEVRTRGGELRDEAELGDALLGLVAVARERGWDAERALRERLRLLEGEIRDAEAEARGIPTSAVGPEAEARGDDLEG